MGIFGKIKKAVAVARIGAAVGKTVVTGKESKHFDRVEKGADIAEKSLEIADMIKTLFPKK